MVYSVTGKFKSPWKDPKCDAVMTVLEASGEETFSALPEDVKMALNCYLDGKFEKGWFTDNRECRAAEKFWWNTVAEAKGEEFEEEEEEEGEYLMPMKLTWEEKEIPYPEMDAPARKSNADRQREASKPEGWDEDVEDWKEKEKTKWGVGGPGGVTIFEEEPLAMKLKTQKKEEMEKKIVG